MTSIITGNGLGTFNTSLNLLGNAGPNGNPTLGKLGDKLYVNAADGNLVIQHQDDYLAATGLGVAFIRTYNSQGLMTGGGGTNWRFNVQDQLYSLTGTINTAGSTITRINDDGSESLYTYDSTTGHYTNTDGAGAYNTLSFNTTSNIWTWTNGSTQGTQTYNSAGQLLTNQDANGNTTTYGYTGLLLTQITDASGQATYFDYTGNNLSDIRTLSNGVTQTRTRYTYDTANRLSQVIVDLTPADNSIIDGKVYTTTYTYDGTSTRVASITQGDGTRISFTYDVQGRVTSYTDGVGQITQFTYPVTTGVGATTVTDPLGNITSYGYDAQGRLIQVTSPAVNGVALVTQYAYDNNNRLTQITDPRGNIVVMQYDANGNQIQQQDSLGNTLTRTFNTQNQVLTETHYLTPSTGVTGPSNPLTTRYTYDSNNNLRFVMSPEGRVSEYRYNAQGQRTASITYAASVYNTSALTPTSTLTEAQLATWVTTQDLTQTLRTDMAYDFRGQTQSTTTYTQVDINGNGLANGQQSVTSYVYDQAGLLLQTIDPARLSTSIGNDYITNYTYDVLGGV